MREEELREFAAEPVDTEWREDVRFLLAVLDETRYERDEFKKMLCEMIDEFERFREFLGAVAPTLFAPSTKGKPHLRLVRDDEDEEDKP